ncbi:MAG TPA: peptide deformylase [Patescibacteria group bacterium]|nr:peptide deformylase [Patescibacteria group bacterium]
MLSIINAPQDVLSQTAKPVEKIDASVKVIIKGMESALINSTDPEGVGLAAPQVGKSLQIFMIKASPDAKLQVFINPLLTIPEVVTPKGEKTKKKKGKKSKGVTLEGCLSLKDIWGVVHRFPKVHLSWLDENGDKHEKDFSGFMATIIQHEYDHLQGILFPKRVLEQKNQLYKSIKDENDETIFEELNI